MMDEYHVRCGLFGIYAGTHKNSDEWKDKSEVTIEALNSVAQYLLTNHKELRFTHKDMKYVLKVEEIERSE
jgi:hypothetical protein